MLARDESPLKRTPLHALHVARGGKLVPFAGYEMPVQFPAGVLKEHLHTRASAGLFDVSHMGQLALRAKSGKVEDAALALELLVPQDIVAVAPGRQRYAQFTNEDGGLLDDLMVANFGDHLFLVVNAACKAEDEAHLRAHLSDTCVIDSLADRALIALLGPKAESALAKLCADVTAMRFMKTKWPRWFAPNCISNPSTVRAQSIAITPALATMPSSPSQDSMISLVNVRTLASDARSTMRMSSRASGTVFRIIVAAACPLPRERTAMIMAAPRAARTRAVSWPSPDDAPVMRNRLPERSVPASTCSAVVSRLNRVT